MQLRVPDILLAGSLEELAQINPGEHGPTNPEAQEALPAAHKAPIPQPYPLLDLTEDELTRFTNTTAKRFTAGSDATIETAYPCSPVQEGILLARIRFPESYRIERVLEVGHGPHAAPIDIELFEDAWRDVVAQHAVLRTVFAPSARDGAMFDQIVLAAITPHIQRLGRAAVEDKEAAVRALQEQQPAKFSDVRPAHQLTTCVTRDGIIFCKIEIHHSLVDGLSAGLLLKDLRSAYSRRRRSEANVKPTDIGSDFGRYITHLQAQSKQNALQYWKETLQGLDPCHFPNLSSSTIPAKSDDQSIVMEFATAELQRFCRSQGVTIPILMQAVWATTLQGYTQTDDVCFGYLLLAVMSPLKGFRR